MFQSWKTQTKVKERLLRWTRASMFQDLCLIVKPEIVARGKNVV